MLVLKKHDLNIYKSYNDLWMNRSPKSACRENEWVFKMNASCKTTCHFCLVAKKNFEWPFCITPYKFFLPKILVNQGDLIRPDPILEVFKVLFSRFFSFNCPFRGFLFSQNVFAPYSRPPYLFLSTVSALKFDSPNICLVADLLQFL